MLATKEDSAAMMTIGATRGCHQPGGLGVVVGLHLKGPYQNDPPPFFVLFFIKKNCPLFY